MRNQETLIIRCMCPHTHTGHSLTHLPIFIFIVTLINYLQSFCFPVYQLMLTFSVITTSPTWHTVFSQWIFVDWNHRFQIFYNVLIFCIEFYSQKNCTVVLNTRLGSFITYWENANTIINTKKEANQVATFFFFEENPSKY